MSDSLWPHGLQASQSFNVCWSPGICSNSCPLSQWCYPTISSSIAPSPPALNLSQHQGLFQWVSSMLRSQRIGASAAASVLPVNIQGWFSLGLTGLISLLSKGLSRVFSSTTVWKRQFFGTQHSDFFMVQLLHLYMTAGRTVAWTIWTLVSKVMSLLF